MICPPRYLRLLAAGLLLASGALLLAAGANLVTRAWEARDEARRQHRELYLERGRQLLLAGDWRRSLVFLGEAYRDGESDPGLRFLVARAAAPLRRRRTKPPLRGRRTKPPLRGESQDTARDAVFLKTGRDEQNERWVSADLSPDWARIAAVSASGQAALFDPVDGRLLVRLADDVALLRFSPDGEHVAGVHADGRFSLWRGDTGELSFTGAGQVVAFAAEGRRLATANSSGTVRVLSLSEEAAPASFETRSRPRAAALRPDGRRLLLAGERTAMIWNVDTGKTIVSLDLPFDAALSSIEYSPDGLHVAGAGRSGEVRLWDAANGELVALLEGHSGTVCCVSFSPGGGLLVSAGDDATANVWDAERGRLLATLLLPASPVLHAEYGPQEARIATVHADGTVHVHPLPLDDAGAAEIERLRECFVPWRPESGRLLPATPDPRACAEIRPSWEEPAARGASPAPAVASSPLPFGLRTTVTGRVVDLEGTPISGAEIRLRLDGSALRLLRRVATADASGQVRFEVDRSRRHTLLVSHRGHSTPAALPLPSGREGLAFLAELSGAASSRLRELPAGTPPPETYVLLKDADLVETLHSLAVLGDLDLVVAPEVRGTISAELPDMPLRQAFEEIVRAHGLSSESSGTLRLVFPRDGPVLPRASEVLTGRLPKGAEINLSLRNADLYETLRSFARIVGAQPTIDEDVSGSVSAELRRVPWDRVLLALLRLHDLHLEVSGDLWRVRRRGAAVVSGGRE